MNITKQPIDDLSLQVTLNVGPEDYQDKVKKALNETRRKANIPGFRKGYVPMGMIEKLYGRSILLEQVNRLFSEGLSNYIEKEEIHIIGEPLATKDQPKQDFETATEFSFSFDLMLAPQVNLVIDKDLHLPWVNHVITEEKKAEYVKGLQKEYSSLKEVDTIEAEDFLKVVLSQGETTLEESNLNMGILTEEARGHFLGKAKGDVVSLHIVEDIPRPASRAYVLHLEEDEEVDKLENHVFQATITQIERRVDAEENQDFYDRVFGQGQVTTHEAFMEKVEAQMVQVNQNESRFQFAQEARKILKEKAALRLPEELLKRWLFEANNGTFTMEEIEKNFATFSEDLTWQLIRESLMKTHELKVEKEDLMENAVTMARNQLAMYGLNNVPEEHLLGYAERMLKDEKQARSIFEMAEDNKLMDFLRENVTIDESQS